MGLETAVLSHKWRPSGKGAGANKCRGIKIDSSEAGADSHGCCGSVGISERWGYVLPAYSDDSLKRTVITRVFLLCSPLSGKRPEGEEMWLGQKIPPCSTPEHHSFSPLVEKKYVFIYIMGIHIYTNIFLYYHVSDRRLEVGKVWIIFGDPPKMFFLIYFEIA